MSTKIRHAIPKHQSTLQAIRAKRDFLQIDSEVGLTFSGIALTARDNEKKRRATQTARKAYDTIQRLKKTAELTQAENATLECNLLRLKRELQSLGEIF